MDRREFLRSSAAVGGLAVAGAAADPARMATAAESPGCGGAVPGDDALGTAGDGVAGNGGTLLHLPRWKDDAARLDADGVLRFDHRRAYERLATLRRRTARLVVHVGYPRVGGPCAPRAGFARCASPGSSPEIASVADPFGHWLLELCRRMEFEILT